MYFIEFESSRTISSIGTLILDLFNFIIPKISEELSFISILSNIAKIEGKNFINGTHKGCSIKGYDKVIYPEDKDSFAKLIKEKGIYEYFSQVNYSRLSSAIIKKDINIDKEILDKVKITKSFRVVLIDKGV